MSDSHSTDPQVLLMRKFFVKSVPQAAVNTTHETSCGFDSATAPFGHGGFYLSDISSEESDESDTAFNEIEALDTNLATLDSLNKGDTTAICSSTQASASTSQRLPVVPPLKCRKLAVPFRTQCERSSEKRAGVLKEALEAIETLLKSKRTQFIAGPNGLQAKRMGAIQTHLALMVRNGWNAISASEIAAESHGFAPAWGGRQVRCWTRLWVSSKTLPVSLKGRHAKVHSLLDDPDIMAELCAYIRSNKWVMNPQKLADFSKNKLIPAEALKYVHNLVDQEMPSSLKHYMELELFPCNHLKVGKGVSLATARRWLHREGFQYMAYKKGLYFDGHDRPDVIEY